MASLALVSGSARSEHAQAPAHPAAPSVRQAPAAPGSAGPPATPSAREGKRDRPDYDGRGEKPKGPAEPALLAARVLLFPAYVVSEYLVRRPLGAAITYAEKHGLPAAVYDFLALGESHPIGAVPFMLVDFGFNPSVGIYAYWDDAGFEGHQLRLRASTWGPSWLSATATERFLLGDLQLAWTATATRRPDYTFYGIGPDARESAKVRYSGDTLDARFESRLSFSRRNLLEATVGYRGASYAPTSWDADDRGKPDYQPSLDEAVAAGDLDEPPGFRDGFRAPLSGVRLVLDSRGASPRTSGVRLDTSAELSVDTKGTPSSGWLRYGATLYGFTHLGHAGRSVSLALTTLFVDPRGARPVPFTQLAFAGGGRQLAGFRTGRLHDRSAAMVVLRYSWPVWLSLSGALQLGVGNVFGPHLAGIRAGRARLSTAIGLETQGSRDSVFHLLFGVGSETVESGASLDSIRVVAGVRSGF